MKQWPVTLPQVSNAYDIVVHFDIYCFTQFERLESWHPYPTKLFYRFDSTKVESQCL